jgi:hypothetical protein
MHNILHTATSHMWLLLLNVHSRNISLQLHSDAERPFGLPPHFIHTDRPNVAVSSECFHTRIFECRDRIGETILRFDPIIVESERAPHILWSTEEDGVGRIDRDIVVEVIKGSEKETDQKVSIRFKIRREHLPRGSKIGASIGRIFGLRLDKPLLRDITRAVDGPLTRWCVPTLIHATKSSCVMFSESKNL